MEVELFAFPTMENPKAVEDTFCNLLNAKRRGESLLSKHSIGWIPPTIGCWSRSNAE